MTEINQTIATPPIGLEEDCIECDIVIENGAFDGFEGKTINITENASQGDVQAGIEFIYHMREHIVDVGVATIYLFTCYALYLYLKKKIQA